MKLKTSSGEVLVQGGLVFWGRIVGASGPPINLPSYVQGGGGVDILYR